MTPSRTARFCCTFSRQKMAKDGLLIGCEDPVMLKRAEIATPIRMYEKKIAKVRADLAGGTVVPGRAESRGRAYVPETVRSHGAD
jgi:hypothetical protein